MSSCFKEYDVRGRVPEQLNPDVARLIGNAFGQVTRAAAVVVGHDVRESSPALLDGLIQGLIAAGVHVASIGLCGTEEIYQSTFAQGFDGGIMVTASHNPREYNGFKFVGKKARPLDPAGDFRRMRDLVEAREIVERSRGSVETVSFREEYLSSLFRMIDTAALRGLRILVNSGNGCAGPVIDAMARHLPCEIVRMHHEPDGTFPHGIPNPLLPENRSRTSERMRQEKCDLGIAFDGDFDRCFFYDENGDFVEGYYIIAVLSEALLQKHPGGIIIHDPRLVWNTVEVVRRFGGTPLLSRTGHVFIKRAMMDHGAVYGGEMSGHHYYRDFGYCDSGMFTWLLVAQLIGAQNIPLSRKVADYIGRYPISGEINRCLESPQGKLDLIRERLGREARSVGQIDGLSMEFDRWRFNLRMSCTEPLVRLNVEACGDTDLLRRNTRMLLNLLDG